MCLKKVTLNSFILELPMLLILEYKWIFYNYLSVIVRTFLIATEIP